MSGADPNAESGTGKGKDPADGGAPPETPDPKGKAADEGKGDPPAKPDDKGKAADDAKAKDGDLPKSESLFKAPKDGKGDLSQGAPEKYDDFKFPDGYATDAATLKAFTETGRELGLPQATMQGLIDRVLPEVEGSYIRAFSETLKVQAKEIKDDPKIGGSHMTETEANLGKVVQHLGKDFEKDFSRIEEDFLGQYPPFVRIINALSGLLKEGTTTSGKDVQSGTRDESTPGKRFYSRAQRGDGEADTQARTAEVAQTASARKAMRLQGGKA